MLLLCQEKFNKSWHLWTVFCCVLNCRSFDKILRERFNLYSSKKEDLSVSSGDLHKNLYVRVVSVLMNLRGRMPCFTDDPFHQSKYTIDYICEKVSRIFSSIDSETVKSLKGDELCCCLLIYRDMEVTFGLLIHCVPQWNLRF